MQTDFAERLGTTRRPSRRGVSRNWMGAAGKKADWVAPPAGA